MKERITYLIGILLIVCLILAGCNRSTANEFSNPEETPAETPEETPAETPVESLPYEDDGIFKTTSDEMDYRIQKATCKKYPSFAKDVSEVKIVGYYGEYHGVYVVDLYMRNRGYVGSDGMAKQFFYERVGEYLFVYSISDSLYVYISADDTVCYMLEAYEQGILTDDDIGEIYKKHFEANRDVYESAKQEQEPVVEIIDGYWYINGVNTGVKANPGETVPSN